MNSIIIKGANENNLKNVDLKIPRNKIVCFIGVSGSGKSTIAFDIIAKEGQRQYFESLSSFARRYLQKSNRPNIESIRGISPTVIISQSPIRPSPRSTVGTVTEIYTYLRLLYSRAGLPSKDSSYYSFNHPLGACLKCKGIGLVAQIDINKLFFMDKSLFQGAIRHSDWKVGGMRWNIVKSTGFFDMHKPLKDFTKEELNKLLYAPKQLVKYRGDQVIKWTFSGLVTHIMNRNTNVHRGPTKTDLTFFDFVQCPLCQGRRLKKESLEVRLNGLNIGEVAEMSIYKSLGFVKNIGHRNAAIIKPRIIEQLQYLIDSGVGYLSLNRATDTLSGGEAQRVKMARQLGCDLVEAIYVLDEPSAGLHPKDVNTVINNLKHLRDTDNTVLVVEHDADIINNSDYIIELGPGGGRMGGRIIFDGTKEEFLKSEDSITLPYLIDKKAPRRVVARKSKGNLCIKKASKNNLKNFDVDIPIGLLTCLTGVSGSGKSSLVDVIIDQHPNKAVLIGQGVIGSNKRGCIGTYAGVFDEIRRFFAKQTNVSAAMFSYNSRGSCRECRGLGIIDMDMNFLGDVRLKCDKCNGRRYSDEALQYTYRGENIADILEMTAVETKEFFQDVYIKERLQPLIDVGLDYIEIGQSLDTLSGGERQRLKLASKLQNKGELYILDEPTSGLHFADVQKLLKLLNRLVDNGNTVLIIEHNLEVIKDADWIIDLGPEGGDMGGEIVVQGTPKDIILCERSYTGKHLKEYLKI
ncbi:MAG: excinuclease ABC subunit UvrA [Patescibacteria group bacterium]